MDELIEEAKKIFPYGSDIISAVSGTVYKAVGHDFYIQDGDVIGVSSLTHQHFYVRHKGRWATIDRVPNNVVSPSAGAYPIF